MSGERSLTQAEVDALPVGTEVIVTWSGGNGPHRYTITRDEYGTAVDTGRIWNPLHNVDIKPPLTQVWLVGAGLDTETPVDPSIEHEMPVAPRDVSSSIKATARVTEVRRRDG